MKEFHTNIIIIGAGIAGLYTGYKLKKEKIDDFLILEKSNKIGGRMGLFDFENTMVSIGAGVGRYKKDKILKKILKELNLEYSIFDSHTKVFDVKKEINVQKTMNFLKIKYKNEKDNLFLSFKEFSLKYLEKEHYKKFILSTGYTDYENSAVVDVLENYGMDDNYGKLKIMKINWNDLLNNLTNLINVDNIRLNSEVKKIEKTNKKYKISTKDGVFITNKVVIATEINFLHKIFKNSIYDYVKSQPFLRIYVKIHPDDNKIASVIFKNINNGTIFIDSPLQKIYIVDENKGVYMVSYSDNKNAIKSNKFSIKEIENEIIKNLSEKFTNFNSFRIIKIIKFYWKSGTHYFTPQSMIYPNRKLFINKLQNPQKNIYVVGESVALHQGWSNGALETVHNIFNNLIK